MLGRRRSSAGIRRTGDRSRRAGRPEGSPEWTRPGCPATRARGAAEVRSGGKTRNLVCPRRSPALPGAPSGRATALGDPARPAWSDPDPLDPDLLLSFTNLVCTSPSGTITAKGTRHAATRSLSPAG